jgi:hypothetical protein
LKLLSSLGGHVPTHLSDLWLGKEQTHWISLAIAILLCHDDAMAAVVLKIYSVKKKQVPEKKS